MVNVLRFTTLYFFLFYLPTGYAQIQRQTKDDAPLLDVGVNRFEIGTKTANIRTGCIGMRYCTIPSFALGLSGALNVSRHFALDADFLKTPEPSSSASNLSGGHASELLAGARAEVRARHYGFFVRAQSGYFIWSRVITSAMDVTEPNHHPPTVIVFNYGERHHFVSDAGAGVEWSPSSRIHVRGEVTDLIYHYGGSSWLNNLQPSAGIYYGLGKQLDWKVPVYSSNRTHPFFSSLNSVLIAGSVLAITADGITTQRFLAHGTNEGDPFARPLVKYGWSGQIAAASVEISAETLGMYGLHRIGQKWIERMVPVGVGITHGVFAYNNTRFHPKVRDY